MNMEFKQLLSRSTFAAAVLATGVAGASTDSDAMEGVVFCKATVLKSTGDESADVSVTLPFTTTGVGGLQYTYWNLGDVPAGGVADSWHSEGGPGRFVAHNDGRVGAYIYLTSAGDLQMYASYWMGSRQNLSAAHISQNEPSDSDIYGGANLLHIMPQTSLDKIRNNSGMYCLAFTRDMTAKAPSWHLLDRYYYKESGQQYGAWRLADDRPDVNYIGAYMGYLDAGDYMPFDVKFWAPRNMGGDQNVAFTFKVEAASFPLWEHDLEVR